MSVYVDELLGCKRNENWPYSESCHLLADSVEELHRFAEILGMKRSWFQDGSLPHYDLTKGMRAKAVRAGAVEIDRKKFIEVLRKYRQRKENTKLLLLNTETILDIPEDVAVCPICKSKLYATFDHWVEENGKWKAASVHLDCITEPDIDSDQWDYWFKGHYSMPYVDWLPVEIRVLKWINQKYEFDLENKSGE